MANLETDFCKIEVKNPIGVTACDFGGNDLSDAWICSQMFHNKPYEKWLREELPGCLKVCEDHDMLFIGSCSGIGADADTWVPFLVEMEAAGVKMGELDTGGPHATFGAVSLDKSQDSVPTLNREYCHGCGWCVGHCRPNAIKCIHAETGKVVWDGYGTIADWVTT
ncbi:MAG: 4Fe-4S binding protein [Desulfobacteraceae bacterium]|nr:4Fe-4S binding protein [Desulfobacteraceae bacterium]